SSNLVPEVPCDQAIPPPDIHKIRRQVTQSFSKAPRFSAMNPFFPSTDKSNGKRCEPTAAVRGDARRDPLRPARDGAPAAGTLFDCR
ncbi:hypothetical protein, partial [Burkholderia pseudomallei]